MKRWWLLALGVVLMGPPLLAAGGIFAGQSDEEIAASIDAAVERRKVTPELSSGLTKLVGNDDAGVRVRERAAWALGELGIKSAVPALLKAAEHKGLLIRSAALTALERLRPASAVPVFIKVAESDPILPLRQRALVSLGAFRSDKAIQPVVTLSSSQEPELRGAAALAMAAMQSKRNDFSEALKEMTADENPYVKERAERGLEIAKGKTTDVLNQLKASDSDIRFTAAIYFEEKGGSKELQALKDAWNSESDEDVRDELSRAIIATKKRVAAEKERREKQAREKAAAKPKSAAPTGPKTAAPQTAH
jgi:HEAT repeat protein